MKIERSNTFTYHSLQDKDRKVLSIFDLLTKNGVISRTEVAKVTGINIVSISNYIKTLMEKRLVLETGLDVSTGGRKPELVELNVKANHVIGVGVSPDEISSSLVDMSLTILEKTKIRRGAPDEDPSAKIIDMIDALAGKSGVPRDTLKAVGIGLGAGPFGGLTEDIKERLGLEAFAGDDICCAAFGEKYLNTDVVSGGLLYIHSSLGYGVVIKNNECVTPDSEKDAEKARYLRPWDNGLSMAETAKKSVLRGVGTVIAHVANGRIDNVTEDVVMEAARQGDELACNIVQNTGTNLGLRIAYLVNLFEPNSVVLGGGTEKAGEMMLEGIRKTIKKFALIRHADSVRVVSGSLGSDAVNLGAASLAVREIFLRA